MSLEALGYNSNLDEIRRQIEADGLEIGRVIAEHKERYIIKTAAVECEAEITGNMRFTAKSREDFPAVGDWVALMIYDSEFAIIHCILKRFSMIKRQAVGKFGEVQVIAANIDYAFIVQSVDRDFNLNRIERYLTICNSSRVTPIIVLSKTDLIDMKKLDTIITAVSSRIPGVRLISLSNETRKGYSEIEAIIEKGKTYCLLGSSGVGKSTLLNNLAGRSIMQTGSISESTQRGKHITSHRELIQLENGGLLIDNPGMREVGIADDSDGLEKTYDEIMKLSLDCKYADCTHTSEAGCAVLQAVNDGKLDEAEYVNYQKLQKEKSFFESSEAERRKKDKTVGKVIKNYYKTMKRNDI